MKQAPQRTLATWLTSAKNGSGYRNSTTHPPAVTRIATKQAGGASRISRASPLHHPAPRPHRPAHPLPWPARTRASAPRADTPYSAASPAAAPPATPTPLRPPPRSPDTTCSTFPQRQQPHDAQARHHERPHRHRRPPPQPPELAHLGLVRRHQHRPGAEEQRNLPDRCNEEEAEVRRTRDGICGHRSMPGAVSSAMPPCQALRRPTG